LEVIPIEGDVEFSEGNRAAFCRLNQGGQPMSQLDAAALNPDQNQSIGAVASLHNFASHPRQGAGESSVVDDSAYGGHAGRRS
jgi:hypothetical protein